MLRPGKYIEHDFPLHEVNRLAVKEGNAKKPIYTMHKWWARRLSCVFRTILLASRIDWKDWDRLEPWKRDAAGNLLDADENPITDPRETQRRVRREGTNSAWERLYYRLDDEANAVIRWAFTQPTGGAADAETLTDHLARLGASPTEPKWWERIDWSQREPITILDPFMGGGTTIVEALRLGANTVGVDLNPVAWFVVKKETDGCDLDALEAGFRQVKAAVAEEIKSYYKTKCPCCGEQADVMYAFWTKLAPCFERTCGTVVPLYSSFVVAKKSGGKARADIPRNRSGMSAMLLSDGPEKEIRFLKCPSEDCGVVYASRERAISVCPSCGGRFDPDRGFVSSGHYTCPNPRCGATHDILEASKANIPDGATRNVSLPERMFALEFQCPSCDYKAYKSADADDLRLFNQARSDSGKCATALEFLDQDIPPGYNTFVGNPLPQHGYHRWSDMFNERQLVCLSLLRDAILRVHDPNVREYLLLAWSDAIASSNRFCVYNRGKRHLVWLWIQHAFVPRSNYVENNVWGVEAGTNTFLKEYRLVPDGIRWGQQPNDNFFTPDGVHRTVMLNDGIHSGPARARLLARSSEDLTGALGQQEAAIVVTDPPYYGNVMYGELSDFHYVWLRSALSDLYPREFGPPLVTKDEEVLEQVTRGHGAPFLYKDQGFFTSGLTRIFAESGRYLQHGGLLIFTFHHQANEAWASVLQTALDAGYYMTAVIPVHAEQTTSLHIQDKKNISYDAVIVCRKQIPQKPNPVDWQELSDGIYAQAERLVRDLERQRDALPPEDIYVIVVGKCMELYSKHYWHGQSCVMHGENPVGIAEALDGNEERGIQGIGEIVDQLVEESEGRMWPSGLDPVSRFYLVNFLGQSEVPYDRLHRRLRHNKYIILDDLERRKLVQSAKGRVKVVPARGREQYLEELQDPARSAQGTLDLGEPDRTQMTYIDKLHWLLILEQQGVLTGRLMQEWSRDDTFKQMLASITRYLDPSAKGYQLHQRLAQQAGVQGTLDL